jgi:hypothetical protein
MIGSMPVQSPAIRRSAGLERREFLKVHGNRIAAIIFAAIL